jgi:hypothetical protein
MSIAPEIYTAAAALIFAAAYVIYLHRKLDHTEANYNMAFDTIHGLASGELESKINPADGEVMIRIKP